MNKIVGISFLLWLLMGGKTFAQSNEEKFEKYLSLFSNEKKDWSLRSEEVKKNIAEEANLPIINGDDWQFFLHIPACRALQHHYAYKKQDFDQFVLCVVLRGPCGSTEAGIVLVSYSPSGTLLDYLVLEWEEESLAVLEQKVGDEVLFRWEHRNRRTRTSVREEVYYLDEKGRFGKK